MALRLPVPDHPSHLQHIALAQRTHSIQSLYEEPIGVRNLDDITCFAFALGLHRSEQWDEIEVESRAAEHGGSRLGSTGENVCTYFPAAVLVQHPKTLRAIYETIRPFVAACPCLFALGTRFSTNPDGGLSGSRVPILIIRRTRNRRSPRSASGPRRRNKKEE